MQNNHTIITIIYVTNSIDEMMLFDGEQHLERLLQKSLRYQNQQKKLWKQLRDRYHTKGINNQTSAGIPTHKRKCFYKV